MAKQSALSKRFEHFASTVAHATGRPITFVLCLTIVIVWAVSGPIFGFSDTWQLIINTSTTIITFLMVFLIQSTQNRDSRALQAKLDELLLVGDAPNQYIGIEHLSEDEIEEIIQEIEEEAKKTPTDRARATRDVLRRPKRRKSARPAAQK